MNIDTRELDRLLCERLGIEGKVIHDYHGCDLETYDWGNPWRTGTPKCTCTPSVEYPAVSTDGNAMLVLLEALRRFGFAMEFFAGTLPALCAARCIPDRSTEPTWHRDKSLPLAIALAAAAALGIAVPQKEQA